MASHQTVLDYIGKALWDPKPTVTDKQACQLAEALGYPPGWRVVRTLERVFAPLTATETYQAEKEFSEAVAVDCSQAVAATMEEGRIGHAADAQSGNSTAVYVQGPNQQPFMKASAETASASVVASQAGDDSHSAFRGGEQQMEKQASEPKDGFDETRAQRPVVSHSPVALATKHGEAAMDQDSEQKKHEQLAANGKADADGGAEMTSNDESKQSATEFQSVTLPSPPMKTATMSNTHKSYSCIVDRIYAGDPALDCDMFYHHGAAMEAAKSWDPESSTPFDFSGGHLLARQPLFQKGDKVQVLYNDEWWEATVLRRTTHSASQGFVYQVHYSDRTKQSGVDERLIRPRETTGKDPRMTAAAIGLGEGWSAVVTGNNKFKITSPEGDTYTSKKKALEVYEAALAQSSSGDPPWRTTDNEYLGRKVFWTSTHRVSARRTVTVEQVGTVVGWISETDIDKAGAPGFVSERTGKPARLFHCVFPEESHHQYASLLLQTQDVEEYELLECLIDEKQVAIPAASAVAAAVAAAMEPAKKKARVR
ncbi:hypothetical protein MPSEU_000574800 [Mayamaea pseudoterrestris]|nr:hypothetical protein MPSEU_000574800 [Mayamaea pseudoterrestris]